MNTQGATFLRLKHVICACCDVKMDIINCRTNFAKDSRADSLERTRIILDIEEEFNIDIPDPVAEKISTVGDALVVLSRDFGFND